MTSTSASWTPGSAPTRTELGVRLGLAPSSTPLLHGRHVLVVGIDYDPAGSGIAPYTTGLAEHLATVAAGVTVLTGIPRRPDGQVPAPYRSGLRFADPAWCFPEGPRVIRLRPGSPGGTGWFRRILADLGFFANAVAGGRHLDPDLVIGVTPTPAGAAAAAHLARRAGAPLITVVQGTAVAATGTRGSADRGRKAGAGATTRGAGLALRLAAAMERYALRHSTEVAVVSEAFRPAALAAGTPAERLHLLPNWTRVTPVTESRQSAREALGWPLDRFTVVHAGPIGPRQDLGTAIEAARLLALRSEAVAGQARHTMGGRTGGRSRQGLAEWDRAVLAGAIDLVLVGDGSQRGALEQQAFGLLNVRFQDAMDADTHPLALAAADVLLVAESPSTDARSTPGLLASYLSAGRPVLAAVGDGGPTGCELRRTGGAGLRVEPGDPEALAEALISLQSATVERGVMGRAALRYARAQLGRPASLRRLDLIVEAALSSADAGDTHVGRTGDSTSSIDYRNVRSTVDDRSRDISGPTTRKGR